MSTAQATDNEKTVRLTASPALADELQGLRQFNKHYDAVIVDCSSEGFLFPVEDLLNAANVSSELLNTNGSLVFAKSDQILVLTKETSVGDISLHTFSSLGQLYDFSASLASRVQQPVAQSPGIDISDQIIMSTIPVLNQAGINAKTKNTAGSTKQKSVLRAIDNYSSISTIAAHLAATDGMSMEELKEELRYLEKNQLIYPIFPRIRFLAECLRNGTQITLKDYLMASGLISKEKLDELLLAHPSGSAASHLGLGPLCVSKGYFSSRLLEIIIHDLAHYGGGSHKEVEEVNPGDQTIVQSLVGQLGNTDPAGLLQNLSSDRRSGTLTVEHKNRQFQCAYDQGRITHAKLGDINGDNALIDFVAAWRTGIFVFIQRQPHPSLTADACKLTRPLDKLLLNAALAHDNQEMVWKKFPRGKETAIERLPDTEELLKRNNLVDVTDGQPLTAREIENMNKLWEMCDGLSPLSTVIRNAGNITTAEAAHALDCLLQMNLVSAREPNISAALQKFRQLAQAVGESLDNDRNCAILRVSLQSTHGYSTASRLFVVGTLGEIGVDYGAARSAGFSASQILHRLDDWQVRYVECLRQEMDLETLKSIVYRVHGQQEQMLTLKKPPV